MFSATVNHCVLSFVVQLNVKIQCARVEQELAKLRQRLLMAQEKLKAEKEVGKTCVLCQFDKFDFVPSSMTILFLITHFILKARVLAEAENRMIRKNVLQQKINCTLTRTV